MSYAIINGFQASVTYKKNGLIIAIVEPSHNNLPQDRTVHRVAVWGPMAKRLEPFLARGNRFEFRCSIEYVRRNGQSYTNLTAQTWKFIPKPLKEAYTPKPERDDDWQVPSTENRFDTDRRYEGFPAA